MKRPPEEKILAGSVAAGGVASILAAVLIKTEIPAEFFAVAAQIFPVFLVALAIEQRLSDRLGMSEDQYVQEVEWAAGQSRRVARLLEDGRDAEAIRVVDRLASRPHLSWLADYTRDLAAHRNDPPDLDAMARKRYRDQRLEEIALVLTVILVVIVGETTALVGLILGDTSPESGWFILTSLTLIATLVTITLTAFREAVLGS